MLVDGGQLCLQPRVLLAGIDPCLQAELTRMPALMAMVSSSAGNSIDISGKAGVGEEFMAVT